MRQECKARCCRKHLVPSAGGRADTDSRRSKRSGRDKSGCWDSSHQEHKGHRSKQGKQEMQKNLQKKSRGAAVGASGMFKQSKKGGMELSRQREEADSTGFSESSRKRGKGSSSSSRSTGGASAGAAKPKEEDKVITCLEPSTSLMLSADLHFWCLQRKRFPVCGLSLTLWPSG